MTPVARIAAMVALGVLAGCGSAGEPHYRIELAGEHRFHLGDDPAFAAPGFDDAAWGAAPVPGTWRVWAVRASAAAGWYRIRFDFPAGAPRDHLAVDLGVIARADQVFLNGRRIGGTRTLEQLPMVVHVPRVYPLPPELLRAGANLLAIRVRGGLFVANGLLADRIGIGDEAELARARGRDTYRATAAEGALMGFLASCWLLVLFFPKRGRAGRATVFLWASLTLQLVHLGMASVTARVAGWAPDGDSRLPFTAALLAACAMWSFVASITRGRLPRLVIGLVAAGAALALLGLVVGELFGVILLAYGIVGAVAAGTMFWLLRAAVIERAPGAIPIVVGFGGLGVSIATVALMRRPFLFGLLPFYYGLAFLSGCAMVALTRHVRALNQEAQRASEYALEAHTRERNRLARDLHDGLGQMLALLKMQLQRMGRKHAGEPAQASLDEGAEQVDAMLEETRRIARDLRPAPLADRGFGDAAREYAAAMARRSDLEIAVDGDFAPTLREEVGDELYRILQECLTNSLKHSGGRRINVTLADVGDRHILTVTDDGRGLPAAPAAPGMGLASIRERSELLGGACTIGAGPDGGTRIQVSVPR